MADFNTMDHITAQLGGLAAGATMAPLNLQTLESEHTRERNLLHMLLGPGCEGFIFGADPAFERMRELPARS